MPISHFARPFVASSLLCASALLTGCSGVNTTPASTVPVAALAVGNWQISSSEAVAAKLPVLSGELSGTGGSLSGILHSQSTLACTAPAAALEVSGSADAKGNVTLKGPLAGGTLSITGVLAADGKSLSSAQYNVTGGACAFAKAADATAQNYSPISGSYTGTFSDSDGQIATLTATLNQSANADGSGNYTLSGTATPVSNPCFQGTIPISDTLVTGQMFSFTYQDPKTGNAVVANGTFNADATTLTVTSWNATGACGADSGTGTMTGHSS